MSDGTAFVTGAGGEMGHVLIPELNRRGRRVVALDLVEIPDVLRGECEESVTASILDEATLCDLFARHHFSEVFHLAAVLSSTAERDPGLAHRVNVEGTFALFRRCLEQARDGGPTPRLLFPSSIAVYGLPDAETKQRHGAVRESEWLVPAGMYGCNKLYCELIGNYLSKERPANDLPPLDFRAIRFPGLVSADTLPTGGTTDYAPEMIHAAAQDRPYSCFVASHSRLPFMTMPDAVEALLRLAAADTSALTTRVYNIRAFSASAAEIRDEVLRHFPAARIGFDALEARQAIVDSWPADVDDAAARRDWGLAPRHGLREAFADYLVPALRARYASHP